MQKTKKPANQSICRLLASDEALLSGRQDSNLRPPAPKAGAIPGYATPRKYFSGERGIRTPGTVARTAV